MTADISCSSSASTTRRSQVWKSASGRREPRLFSGDRAKSLRIRCATGGSRRWRCPGPLQGGVPIEFEGKVIGAIGVSGNTPQEDEDIAKVGAANTAAAIAAISAK